MKLRSKRSALHARAELVIPWLVNGSLPAEAEPAVRQHIETCPGCREDYEEQLRVYQTMRADGPLVFAAESSYQKLFARIQNPESNRNPESDRDPVGTVTPFRAPKAVHPFRQTPPVVRWLAAAVILQAFAIGLGAWAWHPSGTAGGAHYMTLTTTAAPDDSGPRARIVFRTDLSMGELQTLLQGVGAHIIDGPTDGGAYTLGFEHSPGSTAVLEKRIATLRANQAVLFVEPVQEGVR